MEEYCPLPEVQWSPVRTSRRVPSTGCELTNGFGTLSQAGWTRERGLPLIELDTEGGITLASDGQEVVLVWQRSGSSELKYCRGRYSLTTPS